MFNLRLQNALAGAQAWKRREMQLEVDFKLCQQELEEDVKSLGVAEDDQEVRYLYR